MSIKDNIKDNLSSKGKHRKERACQRQNQGQIVLDSTGWQKSLITGLGTRKNGHNELKYSEIDIFQGGGKPGHQWPEWPVTGRQAESCQTPLTGLAGKCPANSAGKNRWK